MFSNSQILDNIFLEPKINQELYNSIFNTNYTRDFNGFQINVKLNKDQINSKNIQEFKPTSIQPFNPLVKEFKPKSIQSFNPKVKEFKSKNKNMLEGQYNPDIYNNCILVKLSHLVKNNYNCYYWVGYCNLNYKVIIPTSSNLLPNSDL